MENIDEYQEWVMSTVGKFSSKEEMFNCSALGLASEAGEFCDAIKKMQHQGHPFDRAMWANIQEELGDILFYLALAAHAHGIPLSMVSASNIDKLKKRYPNGFETERSINREEVQP